MKNKLIKWLIAAVITTAAILICVSAYRCGRELRSSDYEIETELTEPIRLVQLTDLHGNVFGEGNDVLIQMVAQAQPDLILMTGDMLDRQDETPDVVCALSRKLSELAPVYYGYGNHEYAWMQSHNESLTPALEEAGAVVLDVSYMDIEINGQSLRLGGYHGYYRQPHMFSVTEEEHQQQLDFCETFEDTDRYKILLSHIPTAWLDWGYIEKFPVDLVLSGHYHGGQIRLPLLGGVYAPYIGLFPEYTEGLYTGKTAVCVLSTGLGSTPGIPRINNLPELTVVDLITTTLSKGGYPYG